MGKMDVGMIGEIGRNVERFAGKKVKEKVMEGSDQISASTPKSEVAFWVKEAMDRLDSLADEKTRFQIMENCGYNCSEVNKNLVEKVKARRDRYKSRDEFLEAECRSPMPGTRLERSGNVLYQYYTPRSFTRPMRCYCSLLKGLPEAERVSLTYCHCSRGFVKKYWEKVLERPVKVELMESVVSGAPECRFKVVL